MPEPLAITPNLTSLPPIVTSVAQVFEYVSVVIIALPALTLPSFESSLTAALIPASILSIGKVTPITPVEATITELSGQLSSLAAILHIFSASLRPCSPVQALAQPALATIA